jgi:acyl-CoA synthetase (AMP-forming)/AMP-acid ligase II
MVAETGSEFAALFFGAIYVGAWPVPLPLPTSFGGRDSYIDQLGVQMRSADPKLFFYPNELASIAGAAAEAAGVEGLVWEEFASRPAPRALLPKANPDDIAYLQYSSGSTRFPHGVAVTHRSLLNNLSAHSHGMEVIETDRCVSWLPWYHDMGLVGCFLSPVANQVSADYLKRRISPAARLPGSISSAATRVPRSVIRRPSVTTSAQGAFPARLLSPTGSICPAGGSRERRGHDPPGRDAGLRRRLR